MKKILLTLLLTFSFLFTLNSAADALDFPDANHPPFGPGEFPGFDIQEGSGMASNPFYIPEGGTTITFNYNFLTDEYPGDEEYNDFFAIALIDATTYEAMSFSSIVDVAEGDFYELDQMAVGPHDSEFSYETGVVEGSFSVGSQYEGINALLAFAVFDVGDPDVDSGVIIDNISSPVPYGNFDNGLIGEIGYGPGFIHDTGEGDYNYGGNVHLLTEGDGSLAGVDTTGLSGNYAYMSTGPGDMPPVVPEPISSTLFLIGGATLGFRRFRKSITN